MSHIIYEKTIEIRDHYDVIVAGAGRHLRRGGCRTTGR